MGGMNKNILIGLLILIIVFGFLYYNNYFSVKLIKNTNSVEKLSQVKEDFQITKCKQSYNSCKEIAVQKWGVSFSVIKIQKFSDFNSAEKFYESWKGPHQIFPFKSEFILMDIISKDDINNQFPLVLFAAKISDSTGQIPFVAICDKKGNLYEGSKDAMGC